MKIYRVKIQYETVIRAKSQEDAEKQAHWILIESDEEPDSVEAAEITSLSELPNEWNKWCIPWGELDPKCRTIAEILAQGSNQTKNTLTS